MKILIVDDNRDDRRVLRYMVEKNGHVAIEAEDGSEGLQKARSAAPELIISDALMPVMDGFQFLREVKQEPSLRSIPFVFYSSSYKGDQDVRLATSLGADAYVFKPVDPVELWGKIEDLLRKGITEKAPPVPLIDEDAEYLKRYSEVVAAKLEEKVRELELTLEARNRAQEALRDSENRYRRITESLTDYLYSVRVENGRAVETTQSPACATVTGYTPEEFAADPYLWIRMVAPEDRELVQERVRQIFAGTDTPPLEHRIIRKDGAVRWVCDTTILFIDAAGKLQSYDGVIKDITEHIKAEQERQAHLRFVESMDIINRAIQGAKNLESMMKDVLGVVLTVFDCDRASLIYPCDPEAASYRVSMERTTPEYPGVLAKGIEVPVDADIVRVFRTVLGSDSPVTFGPGSDAALPSDLTRYYGVQSQVAMAVSPKTDKPYLFGVHQCSYPRLWTAEETRLLREIGRRLADALTSLLYQRDLQESEAKYRRLVDTSNEGILVLGEDHLITFINARMADLLGYRSEEMTGRPLTDFMFDEDIPDHQRRMEKRRSGLSEHYERRYCHKYGQAVWTLASAVPILDTEQKFQGSFAMFADITERKKAEQDLNKSKNFLNSIVENIPDMIFVKDAESLRFVRFNKAGEQLLGYSREDLLGKDDYDLFPKEIADHFSAKDREVLASKDLVDIPEETIRTKDEVERILHTKRIPISDESGEPHYLLGISEDITDRKKAENTLHERDAFIRNILESVDEGFVVVDRQYRIVSANRAFCGMTKLPVDRVVGRFCFEVSHHANRPCFESGEECSVRHTFETGATHSVTHTHTDAAGSKQYVEIKSYPITDSSGNVITAIETITDVSERRHLEDQLRQAQKMEAIGTLAGGVAHDFNNILTAIIGYGTLTKMKMAVDDPHRAYLDQILSSSERATHLTQSLLAFSRKQVISPKPVNLNDLVGNIEKMIRRLIGEDIDLSMQLSDSDLVVMADGGQIDQVLMNLVTNARDAMPHGGMLAIMTQAADLDEDFVKNHGLDKPGKHALLTVSDSGCGMDEATRSKIFEPFFTTKEPGSGTGLGLAIVYGIVKQHHGNISVYSEPGKGTTFKILLPLLAAGPDESRPVALEPPRGGTETILLAEDDATVRGIIKAILQDFGYRVLEAADGQEAIDLYQEQHSRIDLLIVDVIMPRKGGREVYDAVMTISPGAKVLFLSGYTADIIHKKGIFEEGIDFMSKPVNPADLARKIRAMLDRFPRGTETKIIAS